MRAPKVLLIYDGIFLGLACLVLLRGQEALTISVLAAAAFLGLWQLILFVVVPAPSHTLRIEVSVPSHHYVQACLHTTLFVYWGLYWSDVRDYFVLILIQLAFAYLVEMLLNWSRGRVWRLGFGPFPIVLSTNLFLWFRDDYFYGQFLLVLLTYLGKEFVTWVRDGRRRHIFNPSSFSLTVVSVTLILCGEIGITRGVDIVAAFTIPPHFYEVVFLLGLVVQFRYGVTPVCFGTALSLVALQYSTNAILGEPLVQNPINSSVFLGLTLLITDPSTSPRSHSGKFIYGVLYGLAIFLSYIVLRLVHQPAFIDKIVMVPFLNLLVPAIDRVTASKFRWLEKLSFVPHRYMSHHFWIVLHASLFLLIIPVLKRPGDFYKSGNILPQSVVELPMDLGRVLMMKKYASTLHPDVYEPFAFISEIKHFQEVQQIYQKEVSLEVIRAIFESEREKQEQPVVSE